ncbi:hypothetical protein QUB36_21405 [Microcoleus sp. AT8-B1]|uniref:hypothetical protein n=1 Tax=unclassified Microcoleus TaxID=2642155 RepID=UPI002FD71C85
MPVPQDENSSLVEGNRQDACSTRREFISCGREQARCLFHKKKIHLLWKGTGKMPVPQEENSSFCGREQARCLFHKMKIHLLWKGTGKMPVPQEENSSLVERASCPFLRIVQYVRFNKYG